MGDFENQVPTQFVVVTQESVDENELASRAAFFAENGDPIDLGAVPTGADVLLTGLTTGTATPPVATDSVNVAIANLQAQIDALSP